MPDNNFEDGVRKKMEELRFVPSSDVWTKVEENIREDRRRRRMLFWLPLTGLLVGGLLWFAWPGKNALEQAKMHTESAISRDKENQENTPASAAAAKKTQATGADTGTTTPSAFSTVSGENPRETSDANSGQTSGDKVNPETAGKTETGNPSIRRTSEQSEKNSSDAENIVTSTSNRNKKAAPVIHSESEYLASVSRATENSKKQAKNVDIVPGGKKGATSKSDRSITKIQEHSEEENPGTENSSPQPDKKDSTAAPVAKKEMPKPLKNGVKTKQDPPIARTAEKTKTLLKRNKIEWGFTASGGVTKQLEKNAIPSDVLARAYANSTVYVIRRSNLNPGPAFSAGLTAAKQIGKTWRIQTGIQYEYASSRLPISSNVYYPSYYSLNALSGVGFAAAAGSSGNKTYTNRYQFIQIPIAVEKQFGLNSPLSAQAGMAFGYLTSVHALIYQPLLDQYSLDNSKFNKFQVSGLFGVYWKVKIDPHWSLRAGPEIQYQLGNFMKSTVSVNDHLLTGAVRVILLHSAR